MMKFAAAAITLLALTPPPAHGFSVTNIRTNRLTSTSASSVSRFAPSLIANVNVKGKSLVLNVSEKEGDAKTEEEEESEEVTADLTDDEPREASDEEEQEVDEELEAIRKEISELEASLKSKNRELDSIEKLGEQYTKGGYARKVAEMESARRSRNAASADSKLVARASVLQNFLPIVDQLQTLTEKYEENEFAKGYSALSWDFNNAIKDLGVSEYEVSEGDAADSLRVSIEEEAYSDSVSKGCVIQMIENGYELEGNVMRMAKAVVSLGPEAMAESEGEDEAEEEASDDVTEESTEE